MRLSLVTLVGVAAFAAGPAAQAASRHGSHHGGSHSSHRSHNSHHGHRSSHHDHHSGHGFLGLGHLFSPGHHHYSLHGYGSSYRYGYGYSYGYPYASYYDGDYGDYAYASGDVRLFVRPARTRVYVDGYYVGIADDFDGSLQRLRLEPGAHEIALALDGFRTARFRVSATAYQPVKVRHDMAPLDARLEHDDQPDAYGDQRGTERPLDSDDAREPSRGGLRLSVSPADASVYVDGEFLGQAGALDQAGMAPGSHRVEIVRPGYVSVTRTVQVSPGTDRELRIDLRPMR